MQDQKTFWTTLLVRTKMYHPLPCHPHQALGALVLSELKALALKTLRVESNLKQDVPKIMGLAQKQDIRAEHIIFHVPGTSLVVLVSLQGKGTRDTGKQTVICWDFSAMEERASFMMPNGSTLQPPSPGSPSPIMVHPNMCSTHQTDLYQ